MFELHCENLGDYRVDLVDGLLDPARDDLASALSGRRSLVVTTPTVRQLLVPRLLEYRRAHRLDMHVIVIALNERTKTVETVTEVCRRALDHGLGRVDALVALGGGICCDIVTVAASLLRRETAYFCLPTTLLGQVDAGIGLKGAVNFAGHKNVLGCFQPPRGVLMDTGWLQTLPLEQVRTGAAEILKIAVMADGDLFGLLEKEGRNLLSDRLAGPRGTYVVSRSIDLMLEHLQSDCFERHSFRRLVDFGHTFSGVLEERSAYRLRHGHAVAVDMALTAALGQQIGLVPPELAGRLVAVLLALGLPITSPLLNLDLVADAVAATTAHRGGSLNLVVPTGLGEATFVENGAALNPRLVGDALSWLRSAEDQWAGHPSASGRG